MVSILMVSWERLDVTIWWCDQSTARPSAPQPLKLRCYWPELLLIGDFNTRVGSDHAPSLALLSRTSRLRKNEQKGQRLLELCSLRNLCITYTFFEGKPQHCVSWKPPRSHRWHQLDLLITRPRSLLNVLSTRSYHSADCNTDHVLVCNSTAQRNQVIPA